MAPPTPTSTAVREFEDSLDPEDSLLEIGVIRGLVAAAGVVVAYPWLMFHPWTPRATAVIAIRSTHFL